jgi:hypothetical protein
MYSDKFNLIRQKINSLLDTIKEMKTERENLLGRIRVLEEELKTEKSGTVRAEKKQEPVQQTEKVAAPTLFDDVSKESIKKELDEVIGEIDQCIEIIEKK